MFAAQKVSLCESNHVIAHTHKYPKHMHSMGTNIGDQKHREASWFVRMWLILYSFWLCWQIHFRILLLHSIRQQTNRIRKVHFVHRWLIRHSFTFLVFFTAFNLNVTLKNDTQIHCSSLNRWTNENSGRQTNRLDCLSTLLSFSFLCRMHHAIRYSCDTQVIAFSTLKLLKCHVDGSGTQSLGMMIHVWAALMRSLLNAKMVHFNVKSLMLLSVAQMKTN